MGHPPRQPLEAPLVLVGPQDRQNQGGGFPLLVNRNQGPELLLQIVSNTFIFSRRLKPPPSG
ncbi:MAG: hypothetical protein D5R97_00540 [Candidatus Syntrophonatronum acetioxidans]|uniref:Uncharacterized protein n=1 Tax=Candidatus Syntrophonatronum acetioxidans TaxID=1795816 RepID=A0A424YIS7_9FIRM|nr:MAG: hypothetical protein D5R97_00540 [Candidatus Syntrophonatronum acetioxidans]